MRRLVGACLALLLALAPAGAQTQSSGFGSAFTTGLPSQFSANYMGLLDQVPGAVAAYSVRCLRAAYCAAGNAVTIRRASDQTQKTIGFIGGTLNPMLVSSFCASTTCYVSTWYCQALNCANNATQSAAGNQPQLVLTGINNEPALVFSSGTIYLAAAVTEAQPYTVSTVAERTGSFTSQSTIITSTSGTSFTGFAASANAVEAQSNASNITATASDSTAHALAFLFSGASSSITVDGTTTAPGTNIGTQGLSSVQIGTNGGGNNLAGKISELVVWPALTAAQLSAVRASQKAAFGTP